MGTNRAVRLFRTSIGRKLMMAVTGAALGGFLVAHLLGNLTLFRGQDQINRYAEWLHDLHLLLWIARGGLLAVVGLHLTLALQLSRENRNARPTRYTHPPARKHSNPASRHMLFTGLCILIFIVIHLLHFTWGVLDPATAQLVDAQGRPDVYNMVVRSFQSPLYAWLYVGLLLTLGVHLIHGGVSLHQTLGFHHATYNTAVKLTTGVLVGLLIAGYCSIPIAVQVGFLTPTGGLQ